MDRADRLEINGRLTALATVAELGSLVAAYQARGHWFIPGVVAVVATAALAVQTLHAARRARREQG